MSDTVRFRTHGKINLFLKVLGLRPDGYHEVETVLHGVSLADDLLITPTNTGTVEIEMRLDEGLVGAIPPAEQNLVYKVADVLADRGVRHEGLRIEILKRVPVGAGMGGGSANAGGAFVVLNEMLSGALSRDDLVALAAEVGSDVPYCIEGGTALATGRGERLTQLVAPDDLWFVLGISNEPLDTGDVYAEWDRRGQRDERGSAPVTLALGTGETSEIAAVLHNDLEPAALALRPELGAKKEALLAAGAVRALVSGSGPTLFALCASEEQAVEVAGRAGGDFHRVVVVHSQPHCLERLSEVLE